jgi:hypothetical protein
MSPEDTFPSSNCFTTPAKSAQASALPSSMAFVISDESLLGSNVIPAPADFGETLLSTLPAGILSRRFRNAHHHRF